MFARVVGTWANVTPKDLTHEWRNGRDNHWLLRTIAFRTNASKNASINIDGDKSKLLTNDQTTSTSHMALPESHSNTTSSPTSVASCMNATTFGTNETN